MDNGSRVNREIYARFCERLKVKFLGPTHLGMNPKKLSPSECGFWSYLFIVAGFYPIYCGFRRISPGSDAIFA